MGGADGAMPRMEFFTALWRAQCASWATDYYMMKIGVDVGGTKIEALGLDAQGREVFRKRVLTPRGDYEANGRTIATLVAECGQGTVGGRIPGALSKLAGLVKIANSPWLIGRPLKRDLELAIEREV